MGAAGPEFVRRSFSYPVIAEKLEQLLKER
jgi:hypothetical protein